MEFKDFQNQYTSQVLSRLWILEKFQYFKESIGTTNYSKVPWAAGPHKDYNNQVSEI